MPSLVLMKHELSLPLDLLRGPTSTTLNENTFIGEMKKRFAEIHKFVRRRMHLCSDKMKSWYDTYSRPISFVPGEQVWLYYLRCTIGKCPKLQSNWESSYLVKKRLNELIYRIVRSPKAKLKVVRIKPSCSIRRRSHTFEEINVTCWT